MGTGALSSLLNTTSLATVGSQTTFAAFKMLPIDPARIRRASSSGGGYSDAAEEMSGASTCQEAVALIVDSIRRACEDVGSAHGEFITDADVVRSVVKHVLRLHLLLSDVHA